MESLTLEQYRKMVEDVLDFKQHTGRMPEYYIVDDCCIYKEDYQDMIERVNSFLLEMGRQPATVEIGKNGFNNYDNFDEILAH